MSNYPVGRPPRSADPQSRLRLAALTAVVAGVVLLAAAAFVLSYSGIHAVALQAGVEPKLAKLYPVIFDAMLVVAGAAAMALRGAGWWSRFYAWACLILLLVAVAIGDAVHAMGTALPARPTRAAVAITPWVLLLLAFGLLLTMLSHFRKARATVAARQEARAAIAGPVVAGAVVAGDAGTGARPAEANGTTPGRAPVSWASPGVAGTAAGAAGTMAAVEGHPPLPPRFGLDFWLGPRASSAPATEAPHEADAAGTGGDDASYGDPVSYGEETGYVHPDSYRDEGEYSPHGDSGGPGTEVSSGSLDAPATDGEPAPQRGTAADNGEGGRPADTAAQAEADEANTAAQVSGADTQAQPGEADAAAQPGGADAAAQVSEDGTEAQPGEANAAAQTGEPDTAAQAGEAATAAQASEAGQESQANAAADDGPAGEDAKDDPGGEPVAARGPGLMRLRSSPTRPEE